MLIVKFINVAKAQAVLRVDMQKACANQFSYCSREAKENEGRHKERQNERLSERGAERCTALVG